MKKLSMKIRTFSLLCVFSIYPMISWGQSWKLSKTMTATLDKGIFTLKTTKESEAMPDFANESKIPWRFDRAKIISINIEEGIVTIGERCFLNCRSITSITLPNSLTSINDAAFANCSSLTSICIPNSVTTIGVGAFIHCNSLASITLPNSLKSINDAAFADCISLTSICIPNSVIEIKEAAFAGCKNITSITIPKSVTTIEGRAFSLGAINIKILGTFQGKPVVNTTCDTGNANSKLKDIYVFWETPLSISSWAFDCLFSEYKNYLHVPSGTEELYKVDKEWRVFNIVANE